MNLGPLKLEASLGSKVQCLITKNIKEFVLVISYVMLEMLQIGQCCNTVQVLICIYWLLVTDQFSVYSIHRKVSIHLVYNQSN